MAIDKSLISGSTSMLILRLLEEKDMYGYEMIETLEKKSNNIFTLKAGTLYPLLHSLEEKGVYVSAGSACSSNKRAVSSPLQCIGLNPNLIDSTVRFSFCPSTTLEEIDYALGCMGEIIPFRRKFIRK